MSRSRALLLVLAMVAAFLPRGAAAAAGACQPGLGIRLVDVPAAAANDPRARSYIVDHVRPGASFSRRVEVCNGTSDDLLLKLYPNAAVISGGSFRILEGRVRNELTDWIDVQPGGALVRAGRRQTVSVTIRVPADATEGERYGVVLAELPPRSDVAGVSVASRVGIRVYLDVGDSDAPRSDFRIESLRAGRTTDGQPQVLAEVRNTGGRALDLRGQLALRAGPGGLSAGPFDAQLGTTLAPGDSQPVTVLLDKAISGGPWTARLRLSSGILTRQAEARITFPDAAGAQAPSVPAEDLPLAKDKKFVVPVAAGLIFILALLLLVVGLLTSRRKAKEKEQPEEPQ